MQYYDKQCVADKSANTIQTRRSRIYYSYMLIDGNRGDKHAIAHYYCTCLTGSRTIGSCAHITYMGIGRHRDFNLPAQLLNSVIIDQ